MSNQVCQNCREPKINCCHYENANEGFVFIGINEAKQIKEKTGLKFHEFLDFSRLPEEVIKKRNKSKSPSREFYSKLFLDNRILRLKNLKKCVFLQSNCKCSIYDFRPSICRVFPFWYEINEKGELFLTRYHEATESKCELLKQNRHVLKIPENELLNLYEAINKLEEEAVFYLEKIYFFAKNFGLLMNESNYKLKLFQVKYSLSNYWRTNLIKKIY